MEERDHWHNRLDRRVQDAAVDAFLDDLIVVYRKHGMAVGHEDEHGGFIVEPISDFLIDWIKGAQIDMPHPEELPAPRPSPESHKADDLMSEIVNRVWPNGRG